MNGIDGRYLNSLTVNEVVKVALLQFGFNLATTAPDNEALTRAQKFFDSLMNPNEAA